MKKKKKKVDFSNALKCQMSTYQAGIETNIWLLEADVQMYTTALSSIIIALRDIS